MKTLTLLLALIMAGCSGESSNSIAPISDDLWIEHTQYHEVIHAMDCPLARGRVSNAECRDLKYLRKELTFEQTLKQCVFCKPPCNW